MNEFEKFKNSNQWQELTASLGEEILPSRFANINIAYPPTEKIYCALLGCAVGFITAFSEESEELPVGKVYLNLGEKRYSLRRIPLNEEIDNKISKDVHEKGHTYFSHKSLWLLPVNLLWDDTAILYLDFNKSRENFSLKRGPWNLDPKSKEFVLRHASDELKIANDVDFSILDNFWEREFPTFLD